MSRQFHEIIDYTESFLTVAEADALFQQLMGDEKLTEMMEIDFIATGKATYDFGKMMFLDQDLIEKKAFPPTVWGNNKVWTEYMLPLKKKIERKVNHEFHVCVCIYYPDGNSGVAYHSDAIAFGDTSIIPSISLGEERVFSLREKETGKVNDMVLKHGSLLVMKEGCQEYYEHSLPIDATYLKPSINLTFRKYGF